MVIKFLTGFPKDLVRDVKLIKKSGVKCIECLEVPLVDSKTNEVVLKCYQLFFKGNLIQVLKAKKIIESLHVGE